MISPVCGHIRQWRFDRAFGCFSPVAIPASTSGGGIFAADGGANGLARIGVPAGSEMPVRITLPPVVHTLHRLVSNARF